MTGIESLRPGDIGFARHVLPRAADLLILAGQILLGEPGYPHHVFVVTKGQRFYVSEIAWGYSALAVEAMPSGAWETEISDRWTDQYVYIRPEYTTYPRLRYDGEAVARAARGYIGTPYSFLDYAAIAGVHLGIKDGMIRRRVTSSKHMICSQLADQAMSDAGWHVFDDGRLPQDVTPAALFAKMMTMPGQFIIPGQEWRRTGG